MFKWTTERPQKRGWYWIRVKYKYSTVFRTIEYINPKKSIPYDYYNTCTEFSDRPISWPRGKVKNQPPLYVSRRQNG